MSKLFSDLYERQSREDEKVRQEKAKESDIEKPRKLDRKLAKKL